jgi:3-oxoacyl-[acyl-carrier-protein] synthase-1
MVEAVHVTCLGLNCSVGLTPQSAAAAMRAAVPGFAEIHYQDNSREPIVGAAVQGLPQDLRGRHRVVELLVRAFERAVDCLPAALELDRIPILVCTGEQGRPGARISGIVVAVEARLGLKFRRENSGHIARGSVSAFDALHHARKILTEGHADACLIAAADTLLDARTLSWLEDANRLKRPGVSDGIIPGECGSVALVTSEAMTPTSVAVHGLGFGEESATAINDEPLLGKGMAAAAKQALDEAGIAMHEVSFRLSDVSAEAYGFEELALAQSRLMLQPRKCQDVWCPAGFIGDCGAALGIVQLAWAEQSFARGYAPGDVALAHGSAVGGARAAAVISGEPQRS